MVGLLILAALVPVPFAIGLSGIRFRRLPIIAAALLCLAYLASVVGFGIWTATCPHCSYGDYRRDAVLFMDALGYGVFLFVLLSMIAIGAVTARVVRMTTSGVQPHSSRTGDEGGNQAKEGG